MKTAREWVDGMSEMDSNEDFARFFEAIQRDALEAAARLIDQRGLSFYGPHAADAVRALMPKESGNG